MSTYYLAVDIGASSGRHMLGSLENGKIRLEEIYRFPNGMKRVDGSLCWAVDYVLLDENDRILGKTYGYRDDRTNGMDAKVYEEISLKDLYARIGIQKQILTRSTS